MITITNIKDKQPEKDKYKIIYEEIETIQKQGLDEIAKKLFNKKEVFQYAIERTLVRIEEMQGKGLIQRVNALEYNVWIK